MAFEWTNSKPVQEKKYLQVNMMSFLSFAGENRGAFEDIFFEHHCQPYQKDGMFVYERFFGNEEQELLTQTLLKYVESKGYKRKEKIRDGEPLVEGYDGILFNVTW